MTTTSTKTPKELRPRARKTSPSPHQAWLRGRLARLAILAPHDAATYLATCDERAAMAFALGAEYEGDGVACPATVEALLDEAMGASVARIATGTSVLRIDFGAQLAAMLAEERDALTASVGLSVADAVREEAGSVRTEAIASGFAVRIAVPHQERERFAAHLLDVSRVAYAVAQSLLGQDPEAAENAPVAPAERVTRTSRRKGAA